MVQVAHGLLSFRWFLSGAPFCKSVPRVLSSQSGLAVQPGPPGTWQPKKSLPFVCILRAYKEHLLADCSQPAPVDGRRWLAWSWVFSWGSPKY